MSGAYRNNIDNSLHHPYYQTFERRIQRFKNWNGSVDPRLLARAGFFFTDRDDYVICFACGIGVKNWDSSCDPWSEHQKHKPRCMFLRTGLKAYRREIEAMKYVTFEERLKSFTELWPGTEFQDPVQMANAGFYYLGVCDHVKSFCCNIHLRSWSPEDIPISEHSRWSPNCDYVKERLMAENLRKQKCLCEQEKARTKTGKETTIVKKKAKAGDLEEDCCGAEITSINELGQGLSIRTEDYGNRFEMETICSSSMDELKKPLLRKFNQKTFL